MNNKNVIDMNENKDMENKLYKNNDIYISNNFKINYTNIEIDNIMNQNQQKQCNLLTKLEKKQLKTEKRKNAKLKKKDITIEKREKATLISNERLLSDEDFKKIDTALAKQQITYASLKRLHSSEREHGDFVKLTDIENIYKKRKHDKQTRIESVKKGQEGRERFGYKDGRQNPLCSKTNREKKKTKAFQMLKHKVKRKVKRSFKEKQIALRNHLLRQRKMK